MKLLFGVFICLTAAVSAVKFELENLPERCDFRKCTVPDPKKINVHLVPHTHDDVGWLKTVDQYYYGARNNIQKAGVQYILDSVVEELIRGKDRRFIYVETAFFWKWWLEQNEEMRAIVHELVRTGQLEFINGGWSMNDEATTHYNSIIDQMTWGHRRLNDTFGRCGIPRVAWHIDPFGHSREQANLFAAMNFDALFFAREDYQDAEQRTLSNTLEHMWQGSDDRGTDGDLLTGMMKGHYGPFDGLKWDLALNLDDPIIDNAESEAYNVDAFLEDFYRSVKDFALGYPTHNILIPMGEDFHYQNARKYYQNMDKLIRLVNNRSSEIKVFYSTPSCYAKALRDANVTFTSKNDDFFPYASDQNSYWTGYYTSRTAQKRFERVGNQMLQTCKQVDVLAGNGERYEKNVTKLREMMGVMQHHDAVAGTEKQHVANDYNKNLHQAIVGCQAVITNSLRNLAPSSSSAPLMEQYCDQLNVSSCLFTETTSHFTVSLYNPLGQTVVNWTIRLPVAGDAPYNVTDASGALLKSTLVPVPEAVQRIPERLTKAKWELVFTVPTIPPLGLVSVDVKKTAGTPNSVKGKRVTQSVRLTSANLSVVFDAQGEVAEVVLADGTKVPLKNEFHYYRPSQDNMRNSGAYVFRPDPDHQQSIQAGKVIKAVLFEDGSGVQEVHQKFSVDWISQVVRLRAELNALEFEWTVGPIPIEEATGREVVTRYVTDLKSAGRFFTDANGRQMLERRINYRPSWKLDVNEPVAGNYYPVNSRIALKDEARRLQLTVLTDRSQGGTSLVNGTLELMLHRRLLLDDWFGVGEPLNETGTDGRGLIVRGRHLVQLSPLATAAAGHRKLGQQMFLEPVVAFASQMASGQKIPLPFGGLREDLPANIHLLTLEQWSAGQLLLRLEHFYQKAEDAKLSKPVTVSLKRLFSHLEVLSAQELTLSANAPVSALKNRLTYKYTPIGTVQTPATVPLDQTKLEVTLNPMQIRTFAIRVKRV